MTQIEKKGYSGNSGAGAAAEYFANQAANVAKTMPDIINEGEARRLAANLVTKANNALKDKGKSWRDIDAASFTADLIRVVTLGLDAAADEVYTILYGNKIDVSESARGLRKLVTSYPAGPRQIIDFRAYPVRDGDHFTLTRTPGDDKWEYKEKLFSNSEVLGYVTIAIFDNHTSNVMTHSLEDIQKRRDASRSPNSPAWTKWGVEMAIAKATRRHCRELGWALPTAKREALEELDAAEGKGEALDITPKIQLLEEQEPPQIRAQDQQQAVINLETNTDRPEEPEAVESKQDEPQDAPPEPYEPAQQEIDMSWAEL